MTATAKLEGAPTLVQNAVDGVAEELHHGVGGSTQGDLGQLGTAKFLHVSENLNQIERHLRPSVSSLNLEPATALPWRGLLCLDHPSCAFRAPSQAGLLWSHGRHGTGAKDGEGLRMSESSRSTTSIYHTHCKSYIATLHATTLTFLVLLARCASKIVSYRSFKAIAEASCVLIAL